MVATTFVSFGSTSAFGKTASTCPALGGGSLGTFSPPSGGSPPIEVAASPVEPPPPVEPPLPSASDPPLLAGDPAPPPAPLPACDPELGRRPPVLEESEHAERHMASPQPI